MDERSRRRFLRQTAGAVGVAGLAAAAGCNETADSGVDDTTTGRVTPDDAPRSTATEPITDADRPTTVGTPMPALDGIWGSYRHDSRNTGGTDEPGPGERGDPLWRQVAAVGSPETAPAAADGAFVVVTDTGLPLAVEAANGSTRWVGTVDVATDVSPVVTDGVAVVAAGDRAVALGTDDGTVRWRTSLDGRIVGFAVTTEGVVAATTGGVTSLRASDGGKRWRTGADGSVSTPPDAAGSTVAVGLDTGDVLALESSDGRERWQAGVGTASDISPAVAGGRVYVADGSRVVSIEAKSGATAWDRRLDREVAVPPVATSDGVFVATLEMGVDVETTEPPGTPRPTDANARGYAADLVALAQTGGSERWSLNLTGAINFTSRAPPLAVGHAAGTVYAVVEGQFIAVDSDSGERLWTTEAQGPGVRPVVTDGAVSTGHAGFDVDDGAKTWAFESSQGVTSSPVVAGNSLFVGSDDGHVYALAANTGAIRWRGRALGPVRAAPAVGGDALYAGTLEGHVHAFDRSDGSRLWTFETGGTHSFAPTLADGTVYVGDFGDHLWAIDADDGSERWRVDLDDQFLAGTPAVADGTAVAGDNGRLRAYDAADGSVLWTVDAEQRTVTQSLPAIVDGQVYLTLGRDVRAFDIADGTEAWSRSVGSTSDRPPALLDGTVYAPTESAVLALDADGGAEQWRTRVGQFVEVVAAADAVVALSDGAITALDPADGSVRWQDSSLDVRASPAVAGEYCFVSDSGGRVHALGAPRDS